MVKPAPTHGLKTPAIIAAAGGGVLLLVVVVSVGGWMLVRGDGKNIAAIAIGAPVSRLEPRLAEMRPIISDIAGRASGSTRSMMRASQSAATTGATKPVAAAGRRSAAR